MRAIDLNCDVGEGVGNEAEILPWVSSASIACGAHAGDERTMAETMELARRSGVVVGAHPGFADREGFGRREMELSDGAIVDLVAGQLEALKRHGDFSFVKPHGALYNLAAREMRVAAAIVEGIRAFDPNLALMGLAGSQLIAAGRAGGLAVAAEGFVDRKYGADGRLVARGSEGAVIEDEAEAVRQGLVLVRDGSVVVAGGQRVALMVDSVCVHGDSAGAAGFIRRLRVALEGAGIDVLPFC